MAPEGSGEPQGGAPVNPEGSGEPQGGAPVGREESGEPQGGAPVNRGEEVRFELPPELRRYVVEKGSVAVDGVSLTVAGVGPGWFTVALVPHTLEVTTLGERRPGDLVQLEVDVIAKYVERLVEGRVSQ